MKVIESRVQAVAQAKGITTISALARRARLDRSTVRRVWGRDMPPYMLFSTVCQLCKALDDTPIGALFVLVERTNDE